MDSSLSSSWRIFLEEMDVLLSDAREFNIWFKPLEPVSMQDNTLTIRVPSQDYSFKLEGDYFEIFKASLEKAFGEGINLKYLIPTSSPAKTEAQAEAAEVATPFVTHLDARMLFGNFYKSECNNLAYAISETIVKKPGETASAQRGERDEANGASEKY